MFSTSLAIEINRKTTQNIKIRVFFNKETESSARRPSRIFNTMKKKYLTVFTSPMFFRSAKIYIQYNRQLD